MLRSSDIFASLTYCANILSRNMKEEESILVYRCPCCQSQRLTKEVEAFHCLECGAQWPFREGIADFVDGDLYYGELPRKEMRSLLEEVENRSWPEVLHKYFAHSNPFLYQIAMDETRADCLHLLPIAPDWMAIDVGCGWGTITAVLARKCYHVVAIDSTLERLVFVKSRCHQESISNVTPLRADILRPPLAPEQFDLLVMLGVLEWVAELCEGDDPLSLQKRALSNAFSLLKEGGFLVLGIENRYGLKYLLGAEDDHTGLKFISFLPREEADYYSIQERGRPFRTYTHSYEGYRRLLSEVGFQEIEFYYPIPDYKTALFHLPIEDKEAFKYYLDYLASPRYYLENSFHRSMTPRRWGAVLDMERALNNLGVLPYFVSSYLIIARRGFG